MKIQKKTHRKLEISWPELNCLEEMWKVGGIEPIEYYSMATTTF